MITEKGYVPPEAFQADPKLSKDKPESRFGTKEAVVELMEYCEDGEIEELGSIDDFYPKTTGEHRNTVELVDIKSNHNTLVPLVIHHAGSEDLRCIFKPFAGESKELKKTLTLKEFYPQEAAAYAISETFGFDLVPPTIVRNIKGRIGALQLFMDHEKYGTYKHISDALTPEQIDALVESDDYYRMALLDFIIAHPDRHFDNYLIKGQLTEDGYTTDFSAEQEPELIAIDHGVSLSYPEYNRIYETIKGPSYGLTYEPPPHFDSVTGRPVGKGEEKKTPIPDHLLSHLEQGLTKRNQLTRSLDICRISPQEISYMWQRTKALLEEKRFLSRINYGAFSTSVTQGEDFPHPPLPRALYTKVL